MNSEPKHTPAPWKFDGRIDEGFRIFSGDMSNAIADIDEWHDMKTTVANAVLICAAPDLLTALEEIMLYAVDWTVPTSVWDKARAAIRKATQGES